MTCWLCGFETNELTTNAKVPICKNGPCQICRKVADVDEEINQTVATLRRLLAKRCDLRSKQNHVHGSLIHRLPVELRNYIFELVPRRIEWRPPNTWKRDSCRRTCELTTVCRSWRDIAWSNPSLWSTVRLDGPCSGWNFLHDRILRSQTLPLTLEIKITVGYGEKVEQVSEGFIAGIAPVLNVHDRVRHLRISSSCWLEDHQPVAWLNKMKPETIEIDSVSIKLLQFSWDRLTSAKVKTVDLEVVRRLFQHALQMTSCHVEGVQSDSDHLSPNCIIHQRLETFSLRCTTGRLHVAALLLGSLTLPCLQHFETNELLFLTPAYLPALVRRSSCPLTRITFRTFDIDRWGYFPSLELKPLPGVTDLYVEDSNVVTEKLLLGDYFPDLCHLTLPLGSFLGLWDCGVISKLIDRNRPWPDINEGRLRKFLVVDSESRPGEDKQFIHNSDIRMRLKALHSNLILRVHGFEILIAEDLSIY